MVNDREITLKMLVVKYKFGVTYTYLATKLGVTPSALWQLRMGNTVAISEMKKAELLKLLNGYLKK